MHMDSTKGWPLVDPNDCTSQGTAAGLYTLLMSSVIPGVWSTTEPTVTTARYCLTGTGGNNFLYTDATGLVTNDPNNACS